MENTPKNVLAEHVEPITTVLIHGLKYEVDEDTNQACFFVENIEENSQTVGGKCKKFLWQSQKWIITVYDESKLPKRKKSRRGKSKRTFRRRTKNENEGLDYEVTEIISLDVKDDHEGTSHLREYTWKPKVVNTEESFILVTYLDSSGETQSKDIITNKLSTSYVGNTTHDDFEMTYDDDDYNNDIAEHPNGALAKLTYVSEKLIHVRKLETEEDEKEKYEIEPINIKISFEPTILWINPYEGRYGLSTSHFQLSERFGNSCESNLIKVTTRGGYLSDFSLSYSDVRKVKKSRRDFRKPQYENLPADVIVIDKLEEEESKSTSDDEGFEDIEIDAVTVDKKHQSNLRVDIHNSPPSNYGSSSSPHEYSEIMVPMSPKRRRYKATHFSTGSERTDSESSNSDQQRFYEEEIFITSEMTEMESTILESSHDGNLPNDSEFAEQVPEKLQNQSVDLNPKDTDEVIGEAIPIDHYEQYSMVDINIPQSSTVQMDVVSQDDFKAQIQINTTEVLPNTGEVLKSKNEKLPDELSDFHNFQCKGIRERCLVTDTQELGEEIVHDKPANRSSTKATFNKNEQNIQQPILFASKVVDNVMSEEDEAAHLNSKVLSRKQRFIVDEGSVEYMDTKQQDVQHELSFDMLDLADTDTLSESLIGTSDILKAKNEKLPDELSDFHNFQCKGIRERCLVTDTQELGEEIVNDKPSNRSSTKATFNKNEQNIQQPILFASKVVDNVMSEEDDAAHLNSKVPSRKQQVIVDEGSVEYMDTKQQDVQHELSFDMLDLADTDTLSESLIGTSDILKSKNEKLPDELSDFHTFQCKGIRERCLVTDTQELGEEIVNDKPANRNFTIATFNKHDQNMQQPIMIATKVIDNVVSEEDDMTVSAHSNANGTFKKPRVVVNEDSINCMDTKNQDVQHELSFDMLDLDNDTLSESLTDTGDVLELTNEKLPDELSDFHNFQCKGIRERCLVTDTQELDEEIVRDKPVNRNYTKATFNKNDQNTPQPILIAAKVIDNDVEEEHEGLKVSPESKTLSPKHRVIIDEDSVEVMDTKNSDLLFNLDILNDHTGTSDDIQSEIDNELTNHQSNLRISTNEPLHLNDLLFCSVAKPKTDLFLPLNHDASTAAITSSKNEHPSPTMSIEETSDPFANITVRTEVLPNDDTIDNSYAKVTSTTIDLKKPSSNTMLQKHSLVINTENQKESKEIETEVINDGTKRKKSLKSRAKKMILKPFKSAKSELNKETKEPEGSTEKTEKSKKKSRFSFKKQNSTGTNKSQLPKSQSDTTGSTLRMEVSPTIPKSHSDTTGSTLGNDAKPKYKRSDTTPLPTTIAGRIILLRQNSSDNILDDDVDDAPDYSRRKVKRSHSFDSILNDSADQGYERELKERRRRLAGYSYVNNGKIPLELEVVKGRKYSIEACEKETQKEINFIKQERKKSKSSNNMSMGASLDILDKIQSIGHIDIPEVFLGSPKLSNGTPKKNGLVGKLNIPQAFSVDNLDSIENDSVRFKLTATAEMQF